MKTYLILTWWFASAACESVRSSSITKGPWVNTTILKTLREREKIIIDDNY